jgi:mono/diheme cytochrome c family protein
MLAPYVMAAFRRTGGRLPPATTRARVAVTLAVALWAVAAWSGLGAQSGPPGAGGRAEGTPLGAVVDQYCVSCHNERTRSGGLVLSADGSVNPESDPATWERVLVQLRAQSMPPGGSPRPDRAGYRAAAGWLEGRLDRLAQAPDPGRTSGVHRLNRTEYRHAVRDLLAVDVDVASLLPGDETSDSGFDNNGDVLSISTAQLERYLSAARRISRLAVGLTPAAGFQTFDVPLLLLQDDRQGEDLPLGSRGGIAVRHEFPADGEYLIKVRLRTNWQDYILGMGRAQQLDVRVDGRLVKRFSVGGEAPGRPAPLTFTIAEFGGPEWEEYVHKADDPLEVRVPVQAGPRTITVSFVRDVREPEGIFQPRQNGEVLSNDEVYDGNAAVSSVAIGGPYDATGPGDTPSRRAIFACRPVRVSEETACATRILSALARRAYRRPVGAADVQALLPFFAEGRTAGGSFDAGIQFALERLLVDPEFLLRVEADPAGARAGASYPLSDVSVASRLSFFLWSSIPDEPLLAAAERHGLRTPAGRQREIRRMLADGRASALVTNFAAQWLHLNNLADVVGDPVYFPDFDDNLVEAFRKETELFVASTIDEDRSVLDLLRADYTFVNERLARHYGIPAVHGSRFRRVTLPDPAKRGGILGHGGLLALTSYPTRTSPVLRGKWLLDTIIGAPPPSPPADVPEFPANTGAGAPRSVRERLEQHRRNPQCASCHASIDPLGFSLDHFDALGAWRAVDETGRPVDASGTTPGGTRIAGLAGLRSLLLDEREQFAGTVTAKLMAYALGRALDYRDQPTVRRIVRDSAARDYRWSALIEGIVESPAFLTRKTAHTK